MVTIRPASQVDSGYWLQTRQAFFPSKSESEHMLDIQHYFYYVEYKQAFVAEIAGKQVGLLEIAMQDSFEGSSLAPVALIELWYVDALYRQQGIGQQLMVTAEQWAKSKHCQQIGVLAPHEPGYIKTTFEHSGFRQIATFNQYLKTLSLNTEQSADPTGVILDTNRLIVREAQFKDIDSIIDYLKSNKSFHLSYEAPRPHNYYTKTYWQQRIYANYYRIDEDKTLQFFMFTKDEPNKVIGYANYYNMIYGAFYSCHVGYMMAESAQGYGYMKEALKVSIQYLFKMKNLHRIQANYMPKNKRSGKTLQSLGFEIEGKAKNFLFVNGQWEDHILTSLTNSEWGNRGY